MVVMTFSRHESRKLNSTATKSHRHETAIQYSIRSSRFMNHSLRLIGACLCFSSTFAANGQEQKPQAPIDAKATKETRLLFVHLRAQVDKGVLIGHQDATAYGVGWQGTPVRSDIASVCGSFPAVYGWDLGDIYQEANIDGVRFSDMKAWIKEADACGGINTLSLHLDHPVSGKNAWDNSPIVTQLLPGEKAYKDFLKT